MRVLGIDPGLRNMGWGVIDVDGSRLSHVANGICHSTGEDLGARLLSLHEQLTDIFHRYDPTAAAVEQTFVNKDGAGTLKLGQARGIALLVPAQYGLSVGEYAPNSVKKTVVGVGHAAKEQAENEKAPLSGNQGGSVPLPPGQLDFFYANKFDPSCCATTSYSGSNGCPCISPQQMEYLNSRAGNRDMTESASLY